MDKMKVGFVCSSFDLLHAGHVLMLETAKENCDWLIVGLQTDPTIDRPEKNKPVQSLYERWVQLHAIKFIDEIIPYTHEYEIEQMLKAYNLDVRFLGDDYIDKDFTGKELCKELGIEIVYVSRKHGFSTTELRERVKRS